MRWWLTLALCGCTTGFIGPGAPLAPHWQSSRDPDSTRDPTKMQTANPWAGEASGPPGPGRGGSGGAQPGAGNNAGGAMAQPGTRRYKLEHLVAWGLSGFAPMIMWSGTFEENELAHDANAADESRGEPYTEPDRDR